MIVAAVEIRDPHEGDESHQCIFLQDLGLQQVKDDNCMWRQMSQRQNETLLCTSHSALRSLWSPVPR